MTTPDNNATPVDDDLPTGWTVMTSPKGVKYISVDPKDETNTAPVFILRTLDYYHLRMYILTGTTFPSTKKDFEDRISRANCEKLNDLDKNAYYDARDALVSVNNHCNDFSGVMGAWALLTNDVIGYANYALKNLTGDDSMTENLAILVSDKYKPDANGKEAAHDSAYDEAVATIQDICNDLKTKADAYKTKTDTQVTKITAFSTDLTNDKAAVDKLDYRFNSRTDDNNAPRTPYADVLNEELARLRTDAANQAKTAKEQHEEYDHDVVVATTTLTYAWWFPIGTAVAAGIAGEWGRRAAAAKEAYEKAEKKLKTDLEQEADLAALFNWTTHIGVTFHMLDSLMADALAAVKGISEMFNTQSQALQGISDDLGSVNGKLNLSWKRRRRAYNALKSCVDEWKIVQRVAKEFLSNMDINITRGDSTATLGSLDPPKSTASTTT